MHLRVKTTGKPAMDVTEGALQNLIDMCDFMSEQVDVAFEE